MWRGPETKDLGSNNTFESSREVGTHNHGKLHDENYIKIDIVCDTYYFSY